MRFGKRFTTCNKSKLLIGHIALRSFRSSEFFEIPARRIIRRLTDETFEITSNDWMNPEKNTAVMKSSGRCSKKPASTGSPVRPALSRGGSRPPGERLGSGLPCKRRLRRRPCRSDMPEMHVARVNTHGHKSLQSLMKPLVPKFLFWKFFSFSSKTPACRFEIWIDMFNSRNNNEDRTVI